MASLEDIAAELAEDTLALMEQTGEDRIHFEVAKVLGASSQTLEEAFLTQVRVRLAGDKARAFLQEKASGLNVTLNTARVEAPSPPAPQIKTPQANVPKPAPQSGQVDHAVKVASIQAITGRPPAKPKGNE